MSDSDNGTPQPNRPAKKELSMETRLLIAFALMGVVLFATQYFFKAPAPEKAPAVKQAQPATLQQAATPPPPPAPEVTVPDGQVAAAKDELFTVDTDVYKIVFSNRGAVVHSWMLKKYLDAKGHPLELVNTAAVEKVYYPLSVLFKNQKPSTDVNQALFVAKPAADGLGIDYEFSNGKTTARKSFRFEKNSYLSQVSSEVLEGATRIPHLLAWRGGFGDSKVVNAAAGMHSLYFDPAQNKLIVNDVKSAKDGPVSTTGTFTFAGIEDTFFAAVALPKGPIEIETLQDTVPSAADPKKEEPHLGVGIGGEGVNSFALFVGPKDIDLLRRIDPKLEHIVDFGWFAMLAKPLFLALNWVNNNYVHNYGWSIVVVTIAINFLLLPLKFSSLKSMKKMQVLQPQIAAINEKYKNIGIRDPKKADQNQEIMALYKRNGVNPMGGCMPLALQIPFFIAYYKVLSVSIEMRGAHWLWITDLSQPETLAIHILPILMIATQFLLQKMTPNTSADPAQQKVMMLMPLMMGFFFYSAQSGLVLYWLTGNIVGLAQQYFFNKASSAPVVAEPAPAPKKKSPRA
jgi:YidC/Oxa1 family membrane protein insertase